MSEELPPRVYREYCWFALVLIMLAIGVVGSPPRADTGVRSAAAATSAPVRPIP
jgi:hypothetical protein